jgi:hypothetical protein
MNNQQFVGLVTQVATNAALSVINKAGIIDLRIQEAIKIELTAKISGAVTVVSEANKPANFEMPADLSQPQDPVAIRLAQMEALLRKVAKGVYLLSDLDGDLTPEEEALIASLG